MEVMNWLGTVVMYSVCSRASLGTNTAIPRQDIGVCVCVFSGLAPQRYRSEGAQPLFCATLPHGSVLCALANAFLMSLVLVIFFFKMGVVRFSIFLWLSAL